MMRRLRRFLALSPARRRLFVGAWLALPVIDLMLRVLGLPRTQYILERSSAPPPIRALRPCAGSNRGGGVRPRGHRHRQPLCAWQRHTPARGIQEAAWVVGRPSPGFAIASTGLRLPPAPQLTEAAIAAVGVDAALIAIAGRYALGNGTCLRQALFLWWRLRRRGHRPEIRIGVTLQDGFAAHAWVELGGRPLAQTPEQRGRFAPMEALTRGLPRRT